MQPQIALSACIVFVAAALVLDVRLNTEVSGALWVPIIWMAILSSRPVAYWMNPALESVVLEVEQGSAADRVVLSALIAGAALVLVRRGFGWIRWCKANPWLLAFFLYCGVSVLWSDYPAVALTRWVRSVGSLIVIVVVLTESNRVAATATLLRRCAYILIPFSVLLIKYYRDLGVTHNTWTGMEALTGVALEKNGLGRLCMVCGLFLCWELFALDSGKRTSWDGLRKLASLAVLAMAMWLLLKSDSATAVACFMLGCAVLIVLGLPAVKTQVRYLGSMAVAGAVALLTAAIVFDFGATAVGLLGRDMTLTDRVYVWADLLAMDTNPFVGVGYDSFWLGNRLFTMVQKQKVTAAHNGYLEVYLELGVIGLGLLTGLIFHMLSISKRSLLSSFDFGRLQLVFLVVFLTYNLTESAYKITTSMAFTLFLLLVNSPAGTPVEPQPVVRRRRLSTRRGRNRMTFSGATLTHRRPPNPQAGTAEAHELHPTGFIGPPFRSELTAWPPSVMCRF